MAARRPSPFVETRKAIRFLESVADFRPRIRLFGGEPFLHRDWRAIVGAAVRNGLQTLAVTNGTLLPGRAEELVESGLAAVGISVDPPAVHDSFRGDGTFSVAEKVVREIHAARERLGSPTPAIEIFTTVTEATYSELTGWARRLRDWPIDLLRLQHQIWLRRSQRPASERLIEEAVGDAAFFRSDVDTYCSDEMPDVDPSILERELRDLASAAHPFRIEMYPPLPVEEMTGFYRNPEFRRRTARACGLIWNYAFVDPIGRLYPCMPLDMGSVFDEPFERVWNGPKFRAFRRLLRREERLPLCERCPA
jgi:MoaA/NifB/PqqE/SkfB family radical SAM enzyme